MRVIETIAELRPALRGRTVACVPTMGNLHAGHASLLGAARHHGRRVVASVFVNPLQFGPNEDYAAYPRTPDEDAALLSEQGVDALLLPTVEEMYPRGVATSTVVEVPGISDILCGAFRPGHFQGVATVVVKLLNLVQPEGIDQTRVSFRSFVRDATLLERGAGSGLDRVEAEDEAIVQSVQKGVRSRFYRRGRYSPTRERGLHHFHRLLCRFLSQAPEEQQ